MSHAGLTEDDAVRTPRRGRRRRKRRRRFGSFLAVVLSLAVVGGVIAGLYFGGTALLGGVGDIFADAEDYPGPGTGEVSVTIEAGDSLRAIGSTLADADVVASQAAFVQAAEDNPDSAGIQPGTYTLAKQMRAADAVTALIESTTVLSRVTVPEGYRESQTVARLTEEAEFDAAGLQAAVDAAPLPAFAEGDAEGFLFPATYDITADTTAGSLVATMVSRFGQAAEEVGLEAGAQAAGFSPREIVTIASIIQREVNSEQDMTNVSEVIHNRLSGACTANGVPSGRLQMDSTVHYAVDDYSSVFTTDDMRAIDSPYNTYRNAGLPPGPIASPGEAALAAALNPSGGGYCYFSAVNLETGETKFGVTEAEHDANVAELQAFCRESDLC
ncbi:MAG: endolytic transglycosylase MltG [Jiangellaceae bacterium]